MDRVERWAAVAAFLQQAMLEAGGLKQKDVVDRSGISRETVGPVLAGKPGAYRPATLARISLAVGKPADAIQRILDGEDPPSWEEGPANLSDLVGEIQALRGAITELVEIIGERLPDRGPTVVAPEPHHTGK